MIAIKSRVQDDHLASIDPLDWPKGAEAEVLTCGPTISEDTPKIEENWPTTDEGRSFLVARMRSRQPLAMSDQEIAA